MSISAATIELLVAQGISGDALVAIVRSIETDNGPAQSTGAERQRRWRERQKASQSDVTDNVTSDVTRDVTASVTPPPSLSPSPSLSPDPSPNPAPSHTPPCASRSRESRPSFLPPDGVPADRWRDFLSQRKKKMTAGAYEILGRKLRTLAEAGWPPGEMIDLAIERGWETVFQPKDRMNGQHNEHRGGRQPSGLGRTASAALEVFGDAGLGRA